VSASCLRVRVCAQVWDEVFNFLVEHKVKDLHVTVFLCHPVEGDKVRPSPALSLCSCSHTHRLSVLRCCR
jgi:hypothetical protein